MITRQIPSTGEAIPVIGLGTWQSFDVFPGPNAEPLRNVLATLINAGGRVIDSSPMYGKSEEIVGLLTGQESPGSLFYATKVWTAGREEGIHQMQASFRKFKRDVIDLMQIHNLVDWKTHLQTLRKWKEQGIIRYLGITHYTNSMHGELAKIIRSEEIDFVQFDYSVAEPHAENFCCKRPQTMV